MKMPPIVSPQEWRSAREELLVKEKELTRARDALAAERRRMPRMAVEKEYRFEGSDGPMSLLDLFEGRRQLILYRFFFEPGVADWPESGCRGCSFMADQVAHLAHLNSRDTTFANVSRAPQADIERWKAGMGWEIPWYTITDDFDADFDVDEWHGTNAFYRDDEDQVFRTYLSTSAATRGWAQRGPTSTSPRWAARRNGRTRPRATRRASHMCGGTSTTNTTSRPCTRRPFRPSPNRSGARGARGHDPARSRRRHAGGGVPALARRSRHRAGRGAGLDQRTTAQGAEPMSGETLLLERAFQAPAQAVFNAWTSEEVMRRWFHGRHDWETPEAEVDLRIGGAVRVVMRDPVEGTEHGGGGSYTEIDPPNRLAFTWSWDEEPRETLIELDFEEAEGVTTVRFKHSNLRDEESARSHEEGWTTCFDNLEEALTAS
jgi:predicted dithiol-disulfide oxidoreductase (DUF899 family)/uncharacterized protein YndB with AHSA1/START domain